MEVINLEELKRAAEVFEWRRKSIIAEASVTGWNTKLITKAQALLIECRHLNKRIEIINSLIDSGKAKGPFDSVEDLKEYLKGVEA